MRKITFLSVLFLLTGWINAWAQTLVNNVEQQLTDGVIVALQCRDTNGGPNWYFNGKAVKSETLSYANLYKIRNNEDGTFALQSMLDGTYIGKNGNDQAIKATKADAAPFTATIATATGWTTKVEGTDNAYTVRFITGGTYLNAQDKASTPKYAGGTGGYSIWYVYTFTTEEAKAMQPYIRFASPRGGYLSANGESGNLQHIDNDTETSFWKIELNEEGDGVKLYNLSQTNPLASKDGFSETGSVWYILDNPYNSGYKCISLTNDLTANCLDASNAGSGVGYYKPYSNDFQGTSWQILTAMGMHKFTVTYHIKDANGNLLATQTNENVVEGDPFPAVTVGVSASMFYNIPEGTVTGDGEYDVTMKFSALPFTVSTINGAFASDNHWYQLAIRGKNCTYNPETGHVENSTTALGEANANNVFAFTGDPFNGFKIYNPAAGAINQLYVANVNNQSCTFTEEGATFGLYHNTATGYQFKLVGTTSTHINDVSNTLGVWTVGASATDGGSTFTFTEVEFNAAGADVAKEALTAALGHIDESMWGTDPGYIARTEENLAKIAAAQAVLANASATAAQVNEQTQIITALLEDRIMPEAGKYYMIINAFPDFETNASGNGQKKAMYSDGAHVKWGTLDESDIMQVWTIAPTEGGYAIRNYADLKYPQPQSTQSAAFVMGTEESVTELAYLNANGQFNVKPGGAFSAHTGGHNSGAGTGGNIVGWDGGASGASAWYIHEVEKPQITVIENVTFNYTVNGVVKRGITGVYNPAAPAVPVTFDFVTIGELTFDSADNTVTVPCTYNLPFTASANYETATWYAMDMHCDDTGTSSVNSGTNRYIWTYVAEDEDIELPQVASTEVDAGYVPNNRKWAFVGDPFNGFKIYNKAAGSTLTLRKAEDGNNAAVMSAIDDRNVFMLYVPSGDIENSFALRIEGDNYYVNTQKVGSVKVLRGWTNADGGSSCRVFALTTDIPTQAFYRIKGGINGNYISGEKSGNKIQMVADKTGANEAQTIYYFDGERKLLNYSNGLYIYQTCNFGAVGEANTWTVKEIDDKLMFLANNIPGHGSYMYDNNTVVDKFNRDDSHCRWTVEPVTELPVTVSAAGFATLFAPKALTIPADVEVYTGSINTEKSTIELSLVEGVIPANTAVLVKAAAGTYNFTIGGEAAAVEGNALLGSVSTAATPENTYTLQNQNGQVGFYPYTGTNVNGFKAYITLAADAEVQGLSFDFGDGATGIGEIFSALEAEKATEIYDLAGRRVSKPVKGLYIIGGKKVIVK